jgi:hypothetical protein
MHFYAVEIYIGKINFICETESSFLFSNIKIDAQTCGMRRTRKAGFCEAEPMRLATLWRKDVRARKMECQRELDQRMEGWTDRQTDRQ